MSKAQEIAEAIEMPPAGEQKIYYHQSGTYLLRANDLGNITKITKKL